MSSASSTDSSLNGLPKNVTILFGTMLWGSSWIDKNLTIPDGVITPTAELDKIVSLAAKKGVAVDTAEGYSNAETRLGAAMKRNDAPLHVSTKFLPAFWRWNESHFAAALDGSIARMGGTIPDVYYLHSPTSLWYDLKTIVRAAASSFRAGKMKAFGVSNCDAGQLRAVCEEAKALRLPVAANQFQLNLLTWGSPKLRDTVSECHKQHVTPVCFGIMGQGLLSSETLTAEQAKGNRMLRITGANFERDVVPIREAIKKVAASHGAGAKMSHVCLAWARSKGVVPLVGVRKEAHLEDALLGQNMTLSSDEIDALDAVALNRHTFEKSSFRRTIFVVVISFVMAVYRTFEKFLEPVAL